MKKYKSSDLERLDKIMWKLDSLADKPNSLTFIIVIANKEMKNPMFNSSRMGEKTWLF